MKRPIHELRCADCEYATDYHTYTYNDGTELSVLCKRHDKRVYALSQTTTCEDFKKREVK